MVRTVSYCFIPQLYPMADIKKLAKAASRTNDVVLSLPEKENACQGAIPQAQPGQAVLEFLAWDIHYFQLAPRRQGIG